MPKITSEFEVACPCCSATLVVDANLKRVIRHVEPPSANRPELSDAHRILAEEAARRESLFQQSVAAEKNRGDALSKRWPSQVSRFASGSSSRPPGSIAGFVAR